jgi:RNA polymerase sigma-70 factor, ECF subfamily
MGERHAMTPGRATALPGDEELSRELLVRCKDQEPGAFRIFIHRYQSSVFALVSRIGGQGVPVQDVAQEVFLRAYRAFPAFDLDGPARASTWLLTIAVRLAINARKAAARSIVVPLHDAAQVRDSGTPETERARRELGRAIASAAEQLSDDQRAAFVLSEFHGFSIAEIAAVLEIPERTVKTRLFRARAHLRECLADFNQAKGEPR